jgi:hypothetical protein
MGLVSVSGTNPKQFAPDANAAAHPFLGDAVQGAANAPRSTLTTLPQRKT